MRGSRRFTVNPRRVVHETIDGETILIHLETGAYYSLEGSGAEMWSLLAAGWSEDELAEEIASRYSADAVAAGAAARAFAVEVVREELLDPADERQPDASAAAPTPDAPFSEPKLNKYTDMEYFLLLDPIHEVEEAGWPHERPAEPVAADTGD